MVENYIPKKGDLVWLSFSPQAGHEQKGRRPALVVSSEEYNKIGLLLACPITNKSKGYPFEVKVNHENLSGVVLSDHVKNLDWRARKVEYIGKVGFQELNRVQKIIGAMLIQ